MDRSLMHPKALRLKGLIDHDIFKVNQSDRRDYLGISQIGKCLHEQLDRFLHGADYTIRLAQYHETGYGHEDWVHRRLMQIGYVLEDGVRQIEVVAPWDGRFRGHIDDVSADGDLIEIKSVTCKRYAQVAAQMQPLHTHRCQAHTYLRYGHWNGVMFVYVDRCHYEWLPVYEPYDKELADWMEERAKLILDAADAGKKDLPCECGKCGRKRRR